MQKNQTPSIKTPAGADPGFRLPGEAPEAEEASPPAAPGAETRMEVGRVAGPPVTDTSTRDLAVGAAVFAVLLVVYFFVRNAYVHHLVVRRVAPSSAGSAGWLMFVGLAFMSAAAVLAIVNASKFLTWAVTAPLVAVGLVAMAAALFVGRR